jgi:hypothetical protein
MSVALHFTFFSADGSTEINESGYPPLSAAAFLAQHAGSWKGGSGIRYGGSCGVLIFVQLVELYSLCGFLHRFLVLLKFDTLALFFNRAFFYVFRVGLIGVLKHD